MPGTDEQSALDPCGQPVVFGLRQQIELGEQHRIQKLHHKDKLRADKEQNKRAFDELIKHKDEIEKRLGVSLIWNRGDDIKASKVIYQIENVSIENESDWLQMARFHGEWSKKFYDVIVPYL